MVVFKTPGVYAPEINAFPNAVVEVATAVPAFIGCTHKAVYGNQSLANKPTRIASFAEYVDLFGGPPDIRFAYMAAAAPATGFAITIDPATQYYFYASMRLFFDNGGGACYIVSVGQFDQVTRAGGMPAMSTADLCDTPLQILLTEQEPTMLVVPDAVLLSLPNWQYTYQQMLAHCTQIQSRIAIFDVYDGYKARDYDSTNDVISGTNGFRSQINAASGLDYGVAYYPWLDTSVIDDSEVDYGFLSEDSKPAFVAALKAEAAVNFPGAADGTPDPKLAILSAAIDKIALPASSIDPVQAKKDRASTHLTLKTVSPLYQNVMTEILRQLNIVPPSGAMAGVYTQVDTTFGVFQAPANVGINSAIKPTVSVTDTDQADLNLPPDGKAINAIRDFPGRGLLVWGARTLDGNSPDWKYINVRRTTIMLEQSIKRATQAYIFEPNTQSTWGALKSMISDFLTNQWKMGALVGATPSDAFSVDIGLGSTMTADDILKGYMRITVMVALTHPAEFIAITFQQQMQTP